MPGELVHVGPVRFATGGPVPNVGLALHRLGVPPRLLGKVGDDLLGGVLLDLLRQLDPALAERMIVAPGETTSYSVVISPPGVDRIFLHCPGVNDTYAAADLAEADLEGARVLHFGYPPLMRRIYQDDGRELVTMLAQARRQGVTTTLDMALPDPASEAGQVDWTAFLQRVLPQVDLFVPSAEELLFMLDRPLFKRLQTYAADIDIDVQVGGERLSLLAEQCLAFGAAAVALKLGDQGLYLRTTTEQQRLDSAGRGFSSAQEDWLGRELLIPCYQARVVGTTGAGDATIAGFLVSMLKGTGPETAMRDAVAVGACSVEAADASSAIPTWEAVQHRIADGWQQCAVWLSLPGWRQDAAWGIWYGPSDRQASA
jgi:sugar/nucleoside kinase (ribokinase family)